MAHSTRADQATFIGAGFATFMETEFLL